MEIQGDVNYLHTLLEKSIIRSKELEDSNLLGLNLLQYVYDHTYHHDLHSNQPSHTWKYVRDIAQQSKGGIIYYCRYNN
jgi:hypothetical protein